MSFNEHLKFRNTVPIFGLHIIFIDDPWLHQRKNIEEMWSMTCSIDYYIITSVSCINYCKCAYLCSVMSLGYPHDCSLYASRNDLSVTTQSQQQHRLGIAGTHNGLSNRSADPNTFLTAALLSKNWLLSCCPSGHDATPALVE